MNEFSVVSTSHSQKKEIIEIRDPIIAQREKLFAKACERTS